MINIIIITIISVIFYYVVYKEREISGCDNFTFAKHCDDSKSIYLVNTKMEENDSFDKLLDRLKSILSYHEKAGVWRRCIILSLICVIFVYITYKMNNKFDNIYYYLVLLIFFFNVLYFYHNYLNFHYFRNLKNNGDEIITKIANKYVTNKKINRL
jgi:hypothetical protein